jgi:hypothetical protein
MGGSCGSGVTLIFPGNGSRAPTAFLDIGAMMERKDEEGRQYMWMRHSFRSAFYSLTSITDPSTIST